MTCTPKEGKNCLIFDRVRFLFAGAGGGASAGRVQVAYGSCRYSELSGTTVCMGTQNGLMRDVFEAGAHG
eukprot:5429663-Prymnesium_polylepis.1